MKLYAKNAEAKVLRSLLSSGIKESTRASLFAKLTSHDFHIEPIQAAFERAQKVAKDRMEFMSWSELCDDPSLEVDFREFLTELPKTRSKTAEDLERSIGTLSKYRKIRIVYNACKEGVQAMSDDKVDTDAVIEKVGLALGKAKRNLHDTATIYNFGKRSNISKLVSKVLNEPAERMLQTGFGDYDAVNGGLPSSGVMILAATTSGGKSVVSTNLLMNMSELNDISCIKVTLEMTAEQELKRILSKLSKVPFWKIKHGKCTEREKAAVIKAAKAFDSKLKKKGSFSFISPESGLTIDQLLATVQPFGHKVICVDYISLLEGVDDENQWRVLSAIARVCKIWSQTNDCLVILLAQLDDTSEKLRYSKGMKEHADIVWQWNYADEEVRALKKLPVKTSKARDGELVDFELDDNFEIMSVSNTGSGNSRTRTTSDDDGESADSGLGRKKKKKKKSDSSDSDSSPRKKSKGSNKSKSKRRVADDDDGYQLM